MKIINSSHEIWQRPGTDELDIMRFIEKAGRVCYKSEDRITDGSAERFVASTIKRDHGSVLEHGTLMFRMNLDAFSDVRKDVRYLEDHAWRYGRSSAFRSFLRFSANMHDEYGIVSGNIRAWRDFVNSFTEYAGVIPAYMYSVIHDYPRLFPEYAGGIIEETARVFRVFEPITVDDLQTEHEHFVHHDITMKFTCDRGVTHEIVRHRPASYSQESTRYCNYSGDKFGSEITVIAPSWCEPGSEVYNEWKASCENDESRYIWMTQHLGCTPQEARSVLPTSLKTELVMSAPIGEWRHFLGLRTDTAAHPDIRALAIPALASLKNDFDTGKFFYDI